MVIELISTSAGQFQVETEDIRNTNQLPVCALNRALRLLRLQVCSLNQLLSYTHTPHPFLWYLIFTLFNHLPQRPLKPSFNFVIPEAMGCCSSSVVVAPDVILPDPSRESRIQCTLQKNGEDFVAYQGVGLAVSSDPSKKWFFVNKTGTFWGGDCVVDIENFTRGTDPKNPKQGQVLCRAAFDGTPDFKKVWKNDGTDSAAELEREIRSDFVVPSQFAGPPEAPDSEYLAEFLKKVNSAERLVRRHRVLKWCFSTSCVLTTPTEHRSGTCGVGGLALRVFARGTTAAEYRSSDYDPVDDLGGAHWEYSKTEFVDHICFQLEDAKENEVLATWCVTGAFRGWEHSADREHESPLFSLKLKGGVASGTPVAKVETREGWDPALALTVAYLCAYEYCPAEIKRDLNLLMPRDPFAWGTADLHSST